MLDFFFQRRFNNLVIREREEMFPLWGDEFDDDDEDDECVDALIGAFMGDYTHGPWKWSRNDFSDNGFLISNVTKEDGEKTAVAKKGKKRAREEPTSEEDGEEMEAIANTKVEDIVAGLSEQLKSGFNQVAENFKALSTQVSAMSDQMNTMSAHVSTLEQQVRKLRKRARTSRSGFVHEDLACDDLEAGEKVTGEKLSADAGLGKKTTPLKVAPTKEATPTKTPTKNQTPTKNPTPEDKSVEIEDKADEKAEGKEKEGDPGARVSSLPSPSKPPKREPSKRIKNLKNVNE